MAKKLLFKLEITPALRKLQALSKTLVTTRALGAYRSVFKGKGLEFAGYRPYSQDDDASLIDWKASIRTGEILIKEYVEARDINVFFILASSASMLFGSIEKLKIEYAIELVSAMANAILEVGDNVGIALISNKVITKIYPEKGRQQIYNITRLLVNPDNYGGRFMFKVATEFALHYLKESTVLIIVSDFIYLDKDWEYSLKLLTKKFDVIGIMTRDPRDRTLPEDAGEIVIADPHSNKTLLVDPAIIKPAYEKMIREQELEIEHIFHKNVADFIDISTDKSFVQPVLTLFRERALRWK
ncbi:MAG: DUF58 domain-containing protein [Nanoarchaeota archaeon]